MTYLPTIIGTIVVFIVLILVGSIWSDRRLRTHQGVSREEFAAAFTPISLAPTIPQAVYDYYRKSVWLKDFRSAPDDELLKVFMKGEDDIEDDARFILRELGIKVDPSDPAVRPKKSIRTLRDMVLWLDAIVKQQSASR